MMISTWSPKLVYEHLVFFPSFPKLVAHCNRVYTLVYNEQVFLTLQLSSFFPKFIANNRKVVLRLVWSSHVHRLHIKGPKKTNIILTQCPFSIHFEFVLTIIQAFGLKISWVAMRFCLRFNDHIVLVTIYMCFCLYIQVFMWILILGKFVQFCKFPCVNTTLFSALGFCSYAFVIILHLSFHEISIS